VARLLNQTKNQTLASELSVAGFGLSGAKGLLGRESLDEREALWIKPCRSIHTFFMKFPIDVAFVDKQLKVRAIYHHVVPGRLKMPLSFAVQSVFELSAGRLSETKTEVGDQLYVVT
jgi:uncharacterized protein